MKKTSLLLGGIAIMILFATGCGNNESKTEIQSKSADKDTEAKEVQLEELVEKINTGEMEDEEENSVENKENEKEEKYDGNFKLTAEAIGEGKVKLTWVTPYLNEEVDNYILVRGPEENPEYPNNYWFRRTKEARSATWINLGGRTEHFRVCQYKEEKCISYSNDIEIDIKGEPVQKWEQKEGEDVIVESTQSESDLIEETEEEKNETSELINEEQNKEETNESFSTSTSTITTPTSTENQVENIPEENENGEENSPEELTEEIE